MGNLTHPGFTSADWLADAGEISLGDLDNTIHPIFGVRNFEGANYEILKPSLRLASLFLKEPSLLSFWHAMFYGEETRIEDPDLEEKYGQMYSYRRKEGELSEQDIADTHRQLLSLSRIIRFNRAPDGDLDGAGGRAAPDHRRMPKDLNGCGTHITYGESLYQGLRELETATTKHRYFNWDLLMARLYFAVLVVHEVCHASQYAITEWGHEHFFEDNVMAEAGFSWENFVFGGTVVRHPSVSSEDTVIAICDFPHYHPAVKDDAKQPPARGPVSRLEIHWPVKATFVARLFQKDFWSRTVKDEGAAAFRPPKTLGFTMYNDNHSPPTDFDFDHGFLVPEGYELWNDTIEKKPSSCSNDVSNESRNNWDWAVGGSWDSVESSDASEYSWGSSETPATSVCSETATDTQKEHVAESPKS